LWPPTIKPKVILSESDISSVALNENIISNNEFAKLSKISKVENLPLG
jgi:hypothetical protein